MFLNKIWILKNVCKGVEKNFNFSGCIIRNLKSRQRGDQVLQNSGLSVNFELTLFE